MSRTITREALVQRIEANPGLVLLEALGERYYEQGHLPGARNLPLERLDALAPSVAPDKAIEIVVYCSNLRCQNSHIAALRLQSLGYGNVSVYAGGKQDWVEAGLPLARRAVAA